jgi:hypothetical protein
VKKLYRLYLALAIFALVAASCALVLHRRVAHSYQASAAASERAMKRAAGGLRLQALPGDVDAPGNDVFDDGRVEPQAIRMEIAWRKFVQAVAEERAQIIAEEPPPRPRRC